MAPPIRGVYRDDATACALYAESAGVAQIIPLGVAVPADTEDVVTLIRWAGSERIALVPRGSGSSMANGAIGDGVIVDLSRFTTIEVPDIEARSIRCGPGAVRDAVDAAAWHAGLAFPVDPSSGAFCTIGGMCGTNAAGARGVKFGAMRRWVRALTCVFADGSQAEVRRGAPPPMHVPAVARFLQDVAPRLAKTDPAILTHVGVRKESSGYALADYRAGGELIDLLVGSEGTLALFMDIELALLPVAHATASVFAIFDTIEQAADAATACTERGATAVELLDRTFLDIVREGRTIDVPDAGEAALIVEAEGVSPDLARQHMATLVACCRTAGAAHVTEAPDEASEIALWAIRHAASPTLARLDPHLASMQLVEDGAVPPARFPAYIRGVREIFARHGIRCAIFGHAGDAHAHVNALADVREPRWRERLEEILGEVTGLVVALGGTLSAEHGDGRLRTPLLDRVWSPEVIALFADTKRAFDPEGILNPGVKVPFPGQQPLGAIKYDPLLPPLPAEARQALDGIVREKGWSRFRLGMLGHNFRADHHDLS